MTQPLTVRRHQNQASDPGEVLTHVAILEADLGDEDLLLLHSFIVAEVLDSIAWATEFGDPWGELDDLLNLARQLEVPEEAIAMHMQPLEDQ
jgi:hypothetical protein